MLFTLSVSHRWGITPIRLHSTFQYSLLLLSYGSVRFDPKYRRPSLVPAVCVVLVAGCRDAHRGGFANEPAATSIDLDGDVIGHGLAVLERQDGLGKTELVEVSISWDPHGKGLDKDLMG